VYAEWEDLLALAERSEGGEEKGGVECGEDYACDCEHPVIMSVVIRKECGGVNVHSIEQQELALVPH
jgi:hypothetical protein